MVFYDCFSATIDFTTPTTILIINEHEKMNHMELKSSPSNAIQNTIHKY